MSFATDAAWPAFLLTIFKVCSRDPPHGRYHGAYNTLLGHCFGRGTFDFFVAPLPYPSKSSFGDPDYTLFLTVYDKHHRPMLITGVKDGAWADMAEVHSNADAQIRQRFDHLLDECPLPRLWGLSFLGTSARIYCCDTSTRALDPAPEPRLDDGSLPRDYLEGAWNIDITSQEGFDKVKKIVGEILAGVEALK